MLQTMALAAALAFGPAQGGLNLTNDRITFGGEFGPNRPDARFLPGDIFFLAFDIEGLRPDSQGRVEYRMEMSVTQDGTGRVVFQPPQPSDQVMLLPLGATKLPARAFVLLGLDLRGQYTCRVTVTDKATQQSKTIEKKFQVVEPDFGIVAFHTSYDREANLPAPMQGVAGQTLWLHFVTVGFARDPATKQPHNEVALRVYDANRQPTTQEALVYVINKGVKEESSGIDWDLPLPLNRPGRYEVVLSAKDKVTGKEYRMAFFVKVDDSVNRQP